MPIRKRITNDNGPKRWWCVDMKGQGHDYGRRVHVGRIEATEAQIRNNFGPCVEINGVNGSVYVYGPPRT